MKKRLIVLLVATLVGVMSLVGHSLLRAEPTGREGIGTNKSPDKISDRRAEVPSDEQRKKALELVHEVYEKEIAAAENDELRIALAKKMLSDISTTNVPAEQYVLLTSARDLGVQTANIDLITRSIGEIAERFQIDVGVMKGDAISKAGERPVTPVQKKALGLSLLFSAGQVMDSDDFDLAMRLVQLAHEWSEELIDFELEALADRRAAEIQERKAIYDSAKIALSRLKEMPDDANACGIAGKYLCLVRGDWQRGLPLLAKGNDADLSALARKELAKPNDQEEQAALADSWWARSESETGRVALNLQTHAAYWYYLALDKTKGLQRARIQKRLEQFGEWHPDSYDAIQGDSDPRLQPHDPEELKGAVRLDVNEIGTLQGPNEDAAVTDLVFAPDLTSLVECSTDSHARLWDVQSKRILKTFSGHSKAVRHAALTTNARNLATASDDESIVIWDVQTGEARTTFHEKNGTVLDIAFFPDTRSFGPKWKLICATGEEIHVRNVEHLDGFINIKGGRYALAPHADFFAYTAAGRIKFARLRYGSNVPELANSQVDGIDVRQMRFSPDGELFAASFEGVSGGVRISQIKTSTFRPGPPERGGLVLPEVRSEVRPMVMGYASELILEFSADGKTLAISNDHEVSLFDVATGQELKIIPIPGGARAVAFSNDGVNLAIAARNSATIRLYSVETIIVSSN